MSQKKPANQSEMPDLLAEVNREIENINAFIAAGVTSQTRRKRVYNYEAELYGIIQLIEIGLHTPEQIRERFEAVKEAYEGL